MVLWKSGTRVVGCSAVLILNINFLWRFAVTASSDSFCIVVFGGQVCGSDPPSPRLRTKAEGARVTLGFPRT